MSWNKDDDKSKKVIDRDFVSCTEKYEIDYVMKEIAAICPKATREQVKQAIQHCCKRVPAPHPRKEFFDCLISFLSC